MYKDLLNRYRDTLMLAIVSIFIGIIIGVFDTLFGKVLLYITDFRQKYFLYLIPFLPVAGFLIIYTYLKIGKNTLKGMTLIFETGFDKEDTIPKRLIPLAILSTWLTHLFGASAGREGVAVQLGATISHNIAKFVKIENSKKILLITGMAAGFSGLYETPIAASFFALEVLIAGSIEYKAILPVVVGSFTADFTSRFLGLEKFEIAINSNFNVDFTFILKLIILGIIFGITGGLFAKFLGKTKNFLSEKLQNPFSRIFIVGIILSILFFALHNGRYSGLGTNLISDSLNGNTIYSYDFLLKFILTIVTLSAGFQGGEVTPLFAIGASLGSFIGSFIGISPVFCAALGYTAVFGSATNTFLAPIFIGGEVFGFSSMPYFFIVCALSYVFNGNFSIYKAQKINKHTVS
ncbi:chloride channel protein [Clostridium sp. BJN0001]|uniref:chloride channel protein n=1 Tax=Clostridium sp. BJN0001 TaxID=2930219 RepID=UPI001FD337FF|nr:chloride channel protein [Clostridium sp. BJN0001]